MYCLDIKKMTYDDLLQDNSDQKAIEAEMNIWYINQLKQ